MSANRYHTMRVVIDVEDPGPAYYPRASETTEMSRIRRYIAQSEAIISEIQRHLHDVDGIKRVAYELGDPVCEFCGAPWTEGASNYNGGCCDKDEEGNPTFPKDGAQ